METRANFWGGRLGTTRNRQVPGRDSWWIRVRVVLVQRELQRQRNPPHLGDSLPCRCCEERGASLHVHLEAPRLVHVARALLRRDQWWKSCRQLLGAGNVAEDMITDIEANHTLKFGHQEDVRRDACNVGDETGFAPIVQLNNEMLDFLMDSFEQDQGAKPR